MWVVSRILLVSYLTKENKMEHDDLTFNEFFKLLSDSKDYVENTVINEAVTRLLNCAYANGCTKGYNIGYNTGYGVARGDLMCKPEGGQQ